MHRFQVLEMVETRVLDSVNIGDYAVYISVSQFAWSLAFVIWFLLLKGAESFVLCNECILLHLLFSESYSVVLLLLLISNKSTQCL